MNGFSLHRDPLTTSLTTLSLNIDQAVTHHKGNKCPGASLWLHTDQHINCWNYELLFAAQTLRLSSSFEFQHLPVSMLIFT